MNIEDIAVEAANETFEGAHGLGLELGGIQTIETPDVEFSCRWGTKGLFAHINTISSCLYLRHHGQWVIIFRDSGRIAVEGTVNINPDISLPVGFGYWSGKNAGSKGEGNEGDKLGKEHA